MNSPFTTVTTMAKRAFRSRRGRLVMVCGFGVVTLVYVMALAGCTGKRAPGYTTDEGPAEPCPVALATAREQIIAVKRAVVIKPVADLMERADPSSPLADQALLGDTVRVLPTTGCVLPGGGLVPIQTAANYRGFIAVAALLPWPEPAPAYHSGALWRVVSRFANVYPQPDLTRSNPLIVLPLGVAVRHQRAVNTRWIEVVLPDGRHGFAQRGDLHEEVAAPTLSGSCVVEQALAHEGSPYLWGGRSTYGIDCSGLISNAYRACGATLPRDASLQFRWDGLRPVGAAGGFPSPDDVNALLPGDLLFFTSSDAVPAAGFRVGDQPKITHVGMYLGEGRFVHATTSDRPTVHQTALTEPGWLQRWVGTRRHPQLAPLAP